MNKVKLDFINLIRSNWKYIFFLPIILFYGFLYINFGFFKSFNLGTWNTNFLYGEMLVMGLCFLLGVYSVQNIEDVEKSYPIKTQLIPLYKYFSNVMFTHIYVIFNLLFILISGIILGYSLNYLINIILNVLILNIIAFNFSIIFGMITGRLIKAKVAYLFVIILIITFTPIFSEILFMRLFLYTTNLWRFFSLLEDNVQFIFLTSLGNVYDKVYFIDKIFPIFLIFCGICFLMFLFSRKKLYLLGSLVLFVFGSFIIINHSELYYNINPETFNLGWMYEREKYLEEFESFLNIDNYQMDITLGENFKNDCKFDVINSSEVFVEDFSFALDPSLVIEKILIENKPVEFIRENSKVIIKDFNIEPNENKYMEISYKGNLKNLLNPGVLLNYSSNFSSNLIIGSTWYPIIKLNDEISYEININYKKNLITNLNSFKILNSNNDAIIGNEKYLLISDGFYIEKFIDGVRYVGSEEIINNYLSKYEDRINCFVNQNLQGVMPTTIVIYPSGYGDVVLLEDILIISEME